MNEPPADRASTPQDGEPGPLAVQVVGQTGERLEEMIDAILREVKAAIPNYVELDDHAMEVEERARVTALTMLSLRAMLDHPFDETLIDAVCRTAGRRAVRGFPLSAMLRSNDVKVRVVWDFVAEELFRTADLNSPDAYRLAIDLSTKLLDASARLREEEVGAYLETERERSGTTEQTRRAFFEQLLAGALDGIDDAQQRAEELGYQLSAEYAVAVLALDTAGHDAGPTGNEVQKVLRRLNDAMSFAVIGGITPIVQMRPNSVIAIFGGSREDGDGAIRKALEKASKAVQVPQGCHLIAGLGRIEPTLSGVAASHNQALQALEAARATGVHSGVISYADMLPSLLLLGDRRLAQDSWRATVEPLFAHDAANGTQLVETLSAYLEEGGVLAATAKRLYVHRHTLTPRLEQIEELTGHSLQDHNHLLMLELGLRARKIAPDRRAR
jgi:sugar diacid utilization regulator